MIDLTSRDAPETDEKIDERYEAGYDAGLKAATRGSMLKVYSSDNRDWADGYRRGFANA